MYRLSIDETVSFIDTVTDLSSVTRFHGHRVINTQSVADHSARVGMLAFALALEYYQNEVDAHRVCTYALFHDMSEAILKNDSNSSIKAKYGIREMLNKLEHDVVGNIYDSGSDMSNTMKKLILEDCSKEDYLLLKLADTLDFGLYVWEEVGLGNSHIKPLLESFATEYGKYPDTIRLLDTAVRTKNKILG